MEQSILKQDSVEDFKTISIPQAYHLSLQDEIYPEHQASSRIQISQDEPEGGTEQKIALK